MHMTEQMTKDWYAHAGVITQLDPRFRRHFYKYALWIENREMLGVAEFQPGPPRRRPPLPSKRG